MKRLLHFFSEKKTSYLSAKDKEVLALYLVSQQTPRCGFVKYLRPRNLNFQKFLSQFSTHSTCSFLIAPPVVKVRLYPQGSIKISS